MLLTIVYLILFHQVAQKLFPDFALACFNLLRHKAIMIGPKILETNGVRVQKVVVATDVQKKNSGIIGSNLTGCT